MSVKGFVYCALFWVLYAQMRIFCYVFGWRFMNEVIPEMWQMISQDHGRFR